MGQGDHRRQVMEVLPDLIEGQFLEFATDNSLEVVKLELAYPVDQNAFTRTIEGANQHREFLHQCPDQGFFSQPVQGRLGQAPF